MMLLKDYVRMPKYSRKLVKNFNNQPVTETLSILAENCTVNLINFCYLYGELQKIDSSWWMVYGHGEDLVKIGKVREESDPATPTYLPPVSLYAFDKKFDFQSINVVYWMMNRRENYVYRIAKDDSVLRKKLQWVLRKHMSEKHAATYKAIDEWNVHVERENRKWEWERRYTAEMRELRIAPHI